jgi:hypothetical protein
MNRIEGQQMCRSFRSAGDLVYVDELKVGTAPPGAERETSHATEAVEPDSDRHGAVAYKDFRITVALDGHAEVNSTDAWTVIGTSLRAMRSNPNFGKNPSAVVVKR